jgi:hypothetical protein
MCGKAHSLDKKCGFMFSKFLTYCKKQKENLTVTCDILNLGVGMVGIVGIVAARPRPRKIWLPHCSEPKFHPVDMRLPTRLRLSMNHAEYVV